MTRRMMIWIFLKFGINVSVATVATVATVASIASIATTVCTYDGVSLIRRQQNETVKGNTFDFVGLGNHGVPFLFDCTFGTTCGGASSVIDS